MFFPATILAWTTLISPPFCPTLILLPHSLSSVVYGMLMFVSLAKLEAKSTTSAVSQVK